MECTLESIFYNNSENSLRVGDEQFFLAKSTIRKMAPKYDFFLMAIKFVWHIFILDYKKLTLRKGHKIGFCEITNCYLEVLKFNFENNIFS